VDLMKLLDFIWQAVHEPVSALLALVVCLFLLVCWLLHRSVRRYRDEISRRMSECEDAHLGRDNVDDSLIQLVAELLTTLKHVAPRMAVVLAEYQHRVREIISMKRELNATILERRKKEREASEKKK
jgi:hypothetical protein